jgi:uncharacterized protein (UPF0332 family)
LKEQSRLLLDKARHAIRAAEILTREDETDFAAGRAYYAMFYVASALLAGTRPNANLVSPNAGRIVGRLF